MSERILLEIMDRSELAQSTRQKDIKELSKEEHQFKSIDYVLFPYLYTPKFKPFNRYDLKLSKDRLMSILQTSHVLELAMGYLITEVELQAHYIVNKYYDRSNLNHSVEESNLTLCSKEVVDTPILCMKNAGRILYQIVDLRNDFGALVGNDETFERSIQYLSKLDFDAMIPQNTYRNIEFASINEIVDQDDCLDHHNPFIVLNDMIQVYASSSNQIKHHERRKHRFIVQDDDTQKKPSSMTVSIVFHGEFVEGEYNPARLSVSLNKLQEQQGILSSHSLVGNAPYDMQVINSEKKLGRIFIKYKFDEQNNRAQPLKNCFEIAILAESTCQYSIDVNCTAAYYVNDLVIHELWDYLNKKKEMIMYEDKAKNARLDCRIASTKISMLKGLIQEAEKMRVKYEHDIDSREVELELNSEIDMNLQKEVVKVSLFCLWMIYNHAF